MHGVIYQKRKRKQSILQALLWCMHSSYLRQRPIAVGETFKAVTLTDFDYMKPEKNSLLRYMRRFERLFHSKGVSRPIFKPSDSILLILNKNSVHVTISNISQRFKKFMSYFLWWSIAVGGTLTLTQVSIPSSSYSSSFYNWVSSETYLSKFKALKGSSLFYSWLQASIPSSSYYKK
jgi:hypothetical protein